MKDSQVEDYTVEIPLDTDLNKPKIDLRGQSIPLSSVQAKPIKWLHPGRIPRGKITIIAGDPDVGKTFLTLDIAARVSNGTKWPDGSSNEKGNVLILTAEDDLADTIVPRLKSADADLKNIHALPTITKIDVQTQKELEVVPTLTKDFEIIKQEISIKEPKLLIIDPINAYLPGVDTHRDAELRAKVFAPLKKLAEEYDLAIICVMHLNKGGSQNAKHRVSGSVAYVAASRATWVVVADTDDSTRKLMIPVKFNIGPKPDGMAYKIVENGENEPQIEWEKEPLDLSADEALQSETSHSSERELAKEFLLDLLEDGEIPSKVVYKQASEMSISERTLQRAKSALKVKAFRKGKDGVQGGGVWYWKLPD
jgi:RecA-family ATPase